MEFKIKLNDGNIFITKKAKPKNMIAIYTKRVLEELFFISQKITIK